MKKEIFALLGLTLASAFNSQVSTALAQGTAFTYQGRLNNGATLASGNYDLTFSLWNSSSGPAQVGATLTNAATVISNGLFTVTLDFGNQFPGAGRWLEIGVRTNGPGSPEFATLSPRQQLTAAPYAQTAANVTGSLAASQLTGAVPLAQLPTALLTNGASGVSLAGAFSGNGRGLTNADLASLTGGTLVWGNFVLASVLSAGSGLGSFVAADVNGDGKLDLITANTYNNTLTILTNNGSGGFALAASPVVGSGPYSVVAADVNGDGKVDLISANGFANTLTVLTNDGHGGFVLSSSPAAGSVPYSIVAVDVNGDGKLDLITANFGDDTLTVLTNDGGGGFVLASSPAVGGEPVSLVAADVNGDGKVDLISANYFGNTLTVLTNDGSGGFVVASSPPVGNRPESVVAADVNGDGKVDFISANSGDSTLTVLTNNGSGGFVLASTPGVGGLPGSVAAADVNADGKVDLVSANQGNGTLTVLTNDGSGRFALASTLVAGPNSVVAADVNGDGKADLISLGSSSPSSTLTVLFNTLHFTGSFTGNGAGLTSLDAANIASGTLADARLSADVALLNASQSFSGANTFSGVAALTNANNTLTGTHSGNGAALTALNAANIASGTLADARLSANVPLLNGTNVFAGTNRFAGVVQATNVNNQISGTFSGNGAGLTNLSSTSLTGTIADGRLSANIPLLNGTNVFTGTNRFAGVVQATNANNQINGAFSGNGAGLTNLSSANLTGTIADARLSTNIPLLNGTNVFTGTNRLAGVVQATNVNNQINGTFSGNGAGLTNLSSANLTGTIADARLSTNIPLLNGTNVFTGTNRLAGVVQATNVNNQINGTFSGNGAGLTNLSSANLAGTIADARLSANVALLNANQSFTGSNTFSGAATLTNAGNSLAGDGAALIALNAANVATGILADARLSANVALLNANPQTFAGTNLFSSRVGIGTNSPQATLDVNGSFRINRGTTFSRVQDGIFTAGSSTTNLLVATNAFPVAFSSTPAVMATPMSQAGTDFPDTFSVTVRRVTTTNFVVNIVRVDLNSNWTQSVRVAFHAWE